MLRIHLSSEDLLRTTIASVPPPVWEVVLSVRMVRHRGPATRMPDWRRAARSRLRPAMAPLLDLVPAVGSAVPDFLTPIGAGPDLDSGIDAVLSTPVARVREELVPMMRAGLIPERARPLCDGDAEAWRRLARAFHEYHAAFIEPLWSSVTAAVDADRIARGRALATGGMEQVLGTLDPRVRWDTATLSYACSVGTLMEFAFGGRGMVLQPSLFAHEPTLLVPADHEPVLVYPVVPRQPAPPPGEPLVALLGRTRAAILGEVADGATTTQLARRVGVSLASASQHAAVLRSAGLILTRRTGPAVLHTLTPLGATLLNGGSYLTP